MTALIREARDDDAEGLIQLIDACWSEYPGCILDVDGEVPELRRIASYYRGKGGRFWVAERDDRIVASIGVLPSADAGAELCKLYVHATERRRGMAAALVALVEDAATQRGAAALELWSDTRFLDAHRLYERLGFRRSEKTRALDDISHSVEYHYRKQLAG